MKAYMPVVADLLNRKEPTLILDAPSGEGWLHPLLNYKHTIDGIDLFDKKPKGYNNFYIANLDDGIPKELEIYDAIVSCEGIEHIGNPLLFLRSAHDHLSKDGMLIVTTPNTWYPGAKLKHSLNGFFPGFPPLIGKIEKGTHMHIMPWSFPQLYLYFHLAGYENIRLHELPEEKKPKRIYEKILGLPQKTYCKNKMKKSSSEEERQFWEDAGSNQSVYGRRLVVSASPRRN